MSHVPSGDTAALELVGFEAALKAANTPSAEYDIDQQLRRTVKVRKLRSKTLTKTGAEMTVEVRLDNKQDLVASMLNIDGVYDATLVSCQSEAGN